MNNLATIRMLLAAAPLIGGSSMNGKVANDPPAIPPERKDWPMYEPEPSLPLKERRKLLAKKLREK